MMKRKVLIPVFILLWSIAFNGFSQEYSTIPLTWKFIVDDLRGDFDGGSYYLSKPFSLTLPVDKQNISGRWEEHIWRTIENEHNPAEAQVFLDETVPGKYVHYYESPRGRENIDILFEEKEAVLRFGHNIRTDRFELNSVTIDHISYTLEIRGEIPHLVIRIDRKTQNSLTTQVHGIHAVPDTAVQPRITAPVEREPVVSTSARTPVQHQNVIVLYAPESQPSANGYRNILGQGSLSPEIVIPYLDRLTSRNHAEIDSLVRTYFYEAQRENVNPDIAIAQMLYATRYLSNIHMRTYNYAGFSTEGTRWNGAFHGMAEGIRAHIQHLKGYASAVRPATLVDPRYELLGPSRGTVQNFDQLYRIWTPYNYHNYRIAIEEILADLYRHANNRSR